MSNKIDQQEYDPDRRYAYLEGVRASGGRLTSEEKAELKELLSPLPHKKQKRTPWGKPGSRVSRKLPAKVWSAGKYRDVVFSLYPDGVIGMRLAKHSLKSEVKAMAGDIFRWVAARQARAETARLKAERKQRRAT